MLDAHTLHLNAHDTVPSDGNDFILSAAQVLEADRRLEECADTLRRIAALQISMVPRAEEVSGGAGAVDASESGRVVDGDAVSGRPGTDQIAREGVDGADGGDDASARDDEGGDRAPLHGPTMKEDLRMFQRLVGLADVGVSEAIVAFRAAAGGAQSFTRNQFSKALSHLVEPADVPDMPRFNAAKDRLFELFDIDGNGRVDPGELATGLMLLCSGTRDDKLVAAFDLFDRNGDGTISLAEMRSYLRSVFTVLFEASPRTRSSVGASPADLADVTARDIFNFADLNADGVLTMKEFERWWRDPEQATLATAIGSTPRGGGPSFSGAREGGEGEGATRETNGARPDSPAALNGAGGADADGSAASALAVGESDGRAPAVLQDDVELLRSIRSATGLATLPASEVLRVVQTTAVDGVLDEPSFRRIFETLVPARERNEQWKRAVDTLWVLFDADLAGDAEATDVGSGLSLLCGGDTDARVEAALAQYEMGSDRFVSFEDLCSYLEAVYLTLFSLAPRLRALIRQDPERYADVSPDVVGGLVAEQAFADVGLSPDTDALSFDEFRDWYCTPDNVALNNQLGSLAIE